MLLRSALIAATLAVPVLAQTPAPTTAPASAPAFDAAAARANLLAKLNELSKAMDANDDKFAALLPPAVLNDDAKRQAVSAEAIALYHERLNILKQRTRYTPRGIDPKEQARIDAMLYLFGEPAAVAKVDELAKTKPADAEAMKLYGRWMAATGNADRQKTVADAADAAGAKYPESEALTLRIATFAGTSANLAIREQLLRTCTQTTNNRMSKEIVAELEQKKAVDSMQAAAEKQKAFVGKPMTISGPNVDGTAFTSDAWRGKVVLVDFWATWCGPCVKELPHVKALYEQYHAQGLEIVGISADQSAEPLKKFVAAKNLPWPQLFDAAAAERKESSAMMKQFHVAALPTMFLIDRNGVCRTVTARNELDEMIPKLLAEAAPVAAAPATQPATQPMTEAGLQQRMLDDVAAFQKVFQPTMLADVKQVAATKAEVVPAARKVLSDLIMMGNMRPASAPSYLGGIVFYSTILAVYGDPDGAAWLDAMARDDTPRTALLGKTQQLYVRWCQSSDDAVKQAVVVDEIEALAKANPRAGVVSHQIVKMAGQGAADPALAKRLAALVPNSPATQQAMARVALPERVGKPMTLAGTTPDGKPFTTADLKGKVVLVDFWAVWCGPCKREMPRIKALYAQHHAAGLEVVGVSNDFGLPELKKYVADTELPWPQLFDAASAERQAMHPIAREYGIDAIPTMFLIDKSGVCRSVTARETLEEMIPKLLAE